MAYNSPALQRCMWWSIKNYSICELPTDSYDENECCNIYLRYHHSGSMSHESINEKFISELTQDFETRLLSPEFPSRVERSSLVLSKPLHLMKPEEKCYEFFLFWLFSSKIQHFSFNSDEAISFPRGVPDITIPLPIVQPLNSFVINAPPTPNTKLRWLQTKTGGEKSHSQFPKLS